MLKIKWLVAPVLAVVAVVGVFNWPTLVWAQSTEDNNLPTVPVGLQVSPAFQEVLVTEGMTATAAAVTIFNQTDKSVELELFAFDFQQSDHFGSLALLPDLSQEYPHSLAAFVSLETDRLVIESQERKQITIAVENRSSLTPGGHYAAIIARTVTSDGQIRPVVPAVASLLFVRKTGGETMNLSLAEVDWQPSWSLVVPTQVGLTFSNQGNVHTRPRGKVTVRDIFGRVVAEGTVNENSLFVLPGTERLIRVTIEPRRRMLPLMWLTLKVDGTAEQNTQFAFSHDFILVRYQLLLGLGAIIAALVVRWWWRRKRAL